MNAYHRHRLQQGLARRLRAFEERFGALDGPERHPQRADLARHEVEQLYQARHILRRHLADPPSLTDLAQTVGTNQPQLSRGFRALFGTTVFGFIREARLQQARKLLLETRLPVKAIALEVGYRNTSDLTRGVKSRFGLTPTEMRQRLVNTQSLVS